MEIRSLGGVQFDCLFRAFDLAFKDYDVQLSKFQLIKMLRRRGFNPNLSFAFFENGEIVSFILNGIASYNGVLTAYDTGTGTLPGYRSKGLATGLFEHSLPYLKNSHVRQYLLEVLQHNSNAISLYKNLNFTITRELNYYINPKCNFKFLTTKNTNESIKYIDLDQLDDPIQFWSFYPTWQNSIEAVKRDLDGFEIIASYHDGIIIGYCIYDPDTGDLTQIAVRQECRRRGVASSLLKMAHSNIKTTNVKIVNTESSSTEMSFFLKSLGCELTGKQYEMIYQL